MLRDPSNPSKDRPAFFGETSDTPSVLLQVSLAVRDLWLAGRLFVQVFVMLGAACGFFEVARLFMSDGRSALVLSDPVVMAAWVAVAIALGACLLATALAANSYWGSPLVTQLSWLAAAYAVALQLMGHLTFGELLAWTLPAAFIGTLAEIIDARRALRDPDDTRAHYGRVLSKFIGVGAAAVLGMHLIFVGATASTETPTNDTVEPSLTTLAIAEGEQR